MEKKRTVLVPFFLWQNVSNKQGHLAKCHLIDIFVTWRNYNRRNDWLMRLFFDLFRAYKELFYEQSWVLKACGAFLETLAIYLHNIAVLWSAANAHADLLFWKHGITIFTQRNVDWVVIITNFVCLTLKMHFFQAIIRFWQNAFKVMVDSPKQ